MSLRRLYIFTLLLGLSFITLFLLVGFKASGSSRMIEKLPGGEDIPTKQIRRTVITPDGKTKKEVITEISEGTQLEGVTVPLMTTIKGPNTPKDDKQVQEGVMRFARAGLVPGKNQLRIKSPVIEMWEVDKQTGAVDRSRVTTFRSKYMITDTDLERGDMHGNVRVVSVYKDTQPELTSSHLMFHFNEDRIETDQQVWMSWGEEFKVSGVGLVAHKKTEVATIGKNARVKLIQRGTKLVLPMDPPATQAQVKQQTEIIVTSAGPMHIVRTDKGRRSTITMKDDCLMRREQATLASEELEMLIISLPKPKGASKDDTPETDLRQLIARKRVKMDDPGQGQGFGDTFIWNKLDEKRQKMILRGSPPRMITTQGGQMGLFSGSEPKPKEPKKKDAPPTERYLIVCRGDMLFDRTIVDTSLPAAEQTPDKAYFHKDVKVTRTLIADPTKPLVIDSDKLTLFMSSATGRRSVRRGLAEGNVKVTDPSFITTGQRCDWRIAEDESERMVMTGTPTLLLKNVEDDQSLDVTGKKKPVEAGVPNPRTDVHIASKKPMQLDSPPDRKTTSVKFDQSVVVRRFPLDASDKRISAKPASTMTSDHLEVDLAKPATGAGKPKTGSQFVVDALRAAGNVVVVGEEGSAKGGKLAYKKGEQKLEMQVKVTLVDKDGGIYSGHRMLNDTKMDIITLWGKAEAEDPKEARAVAQIPVSVKKGEAAPKEKRFHEVVAPIIIYRRKDGKMKATATEYQRVIARFWPGEDDNFLESKKKDPAAKKKEAPVPWKLKTKVLEAWMETEAERAAKKDGQKGRLKKLLATGGDVHIYSDPAFSKQAQSERQAFGAWFKHERKAGKAYTSLKGKPEKAARLITKTDQLVAPVINFDHEQNLMICPKGGVSKFKEQSAVDPKKFSWVNIRCDGELRYKRNEWMTFKTNVRMTREEDNSTLDADWARAILDPKTRQMRSAVATGENVVVVQGPDTGRGKQVVWDNVSKIITLTAKPGKVYLVQRKNNRKGYADVVRFNQKSKQTTFEGFKSVD